jgi:hypothetical protein
MDIKSHGSVDSSGCAIKLFASVEVGVINKDKLVLRRLELKANHLIVPFTIIAPISPAAECSAVV